MADQQSPDNEPSAENQAENAQPVPGEDAAEAPPTEAQPTVSQPVEQVAYSEEVVEAPPTDSQPTVSHPVGQAADSEDAAPTEMIGRVQTGPGSRERTMRRGLLVGGAVVLVAALAFGLTQIIRKDAPPAVEETAAAEVFMEPADAVGDSPFAPTGFTTPQPDPTHPGSDPLGPPPAAPVPPPDGQPAPMAMRTANGDHPGLYGGTLDTTTCDAELMFNYLDQNPNKATAWASVHRIKPNQIRAWGSELTPVLLRTDTRVTDHGYIEVGQAIPRQAVLQAGTAVMVDKYGSPRVRCISGSPLLDPVAITAPVARPAGNVAVQPAAAPARPRVVYVGPRWPRFDPVTIVVIRRVTRIIEYFLLWDFRRGALIARRVGILIRDIANLLDRRLARILPAVLLPRPPAARPPAPLPLQPQRPAPQRPPVQRLPAQVPPVQQAPAQVPPVQQAPAPAAPPAPPPVRGPAPLPRLAPPPIVDSWDPPIYDPPPPIVDSWDPPVGTSPGMPGGHPEGLAPMPGSRSGSMPDHPPSGRAPCTSFACGDVPSGGTVSEPPALVPEAPSSSGSGHTDSAPIYDPPVPEVPQESVPAPVEVPQDTGSVPPDYGSLPGPSDTGDSGANPGGIVPNTEGPLTGSCDGVTTFC